MTEEVWLTIVSLALALNTIVGLGASLWHQRQSEPSLQFWDYFFVPRQMAHLRVIWFTGAKTRLIRVIRFQQILQLSLMIAAVVLMFSSAPQR